MINRQGGFVKKIAIILADGVEETEFIAVGDVLTPTTVGITFQWVVAAAGSWLLGSKLGWGLEGVWIAMAADECVRGLIYAVHFKKERWKKNFKGVKTEAELGEA